PRRGATGIVPRTVLARPITQRLFVFSYQAENRRKPAPTFLRTAEPAGDPGGGECRLRSRAGRLTIPKWLTLFGLWWWAGDVPLGRIQGVRSAPGGASRGQAGRGRTPAAGLRRAAQTRRAEARLPLARSDPPAHRPGPRGLFADRRRQQPELGRPAALLLR